jgi:Zn-dependent protease
MAIISFIFSNLWWIFPLIIIGFIFHTIYQFLVNVGRINKITFFLISLPLRLITSLFKGLLASILITFYGFITMCFIIIPIHLMTHWAPLKDIGVGLTLIMIFAPFFYYFIKTFKQELELYKILHNSKR